MEALGAELENIDKEGAIKMKTGTSGLTILLRAYARSAAFSNTEACAKILEAADRLDEQQAEIERLTKCYATATGKIGACGSSSLMRVECKQMTELRAEIERLREALKEILKDMGVYKSDTWADAIVDGLVNCKVSEDSIDKAMEVLGREGE